MQLKRYDPADEGRSYEGCSLTEAHMLAEKQSEWADRFFGDVNNFKLLACRPPLHRPRWPDRTLPVPKTALKRKRRCKGYLICVNIANSASAQLPEQTAAQDSTCAALFYLPALNSPDCWSTLLIRSILLQFCWQC